MATQIFLEFSPRNPGEYSILTTPPKFNSSPLKSYRNPIGKDRLPFPPFFRGELLNFGGVICFRWVGKNHPTRRPKRHLLDSMYGFSSFFLLRKWTNSFPPKKGTILKGKEIKKSSSTHQFSEEMLVFRGLPQNSKNRCVKKHVSLAG